MDQALPFPTPPPFLPSGSGARLSGHHCRQWTLLCRSLSRLPLGSERSGTRTGLGSWCRSWRCSAGLAQFPTVVGNTMCTLDFYEVSGAWPPVLGVCHRDVRFASHDFHCGSDAEGKQAGWAQNYLCVWGVGWRQWVFIKYAQAECSTVFQGKAAWTWAPAPTLKRTSRST